MFARNLIRTMLGRSRHRVSRFFTERLERERFRLVGLQNAETDCAYALAGMKRCRKFLFLMMSACVMKKRMPETAEREQQNRSEKNTEEWSQTFSLHGIIK